MKLRLNSIALRGTDRSYEFQPGLNIIQGEIASGKSSLMQLIHGLFGSSFDNLIPEIREQVTQVEGSITIGKDTYSIIRPVTTTGTAKVEISGTRETARLPALETDATADVTYGQWLLRKLALPEIEIPLSETRLTAPMSPVTINDYFLYCHLRWNEIDTSVLGHHDPFKNRKRVVVFQLLYGIYDVDISRAEADLRASQLQLRDAQQRAAILEQTFAGTALANKAQVVAQRDKARADLAATEMALADETARSGGVEARDTPILQRLRSEVLELDKEIVSLRVAEADELRSGEQLDQLAAQLRAQSRRLTKSIVADTYLVDYDFVRCPRCNSRVNSSRTSEDVCYLCLQQPAPAVTREDLEREQQRLDRQLADTLELAGTHRQTAVSLESALREALERRARVAAELEFQSRAYVSDASERVATRAAERARLIEQLHRYEDYLRLFARMEKTSADIGRLELRIEEQRSELALAESRRADIRERFKFLNKRLEQLLNEFNAPRSAEKRAAYVDPLTYLPIVDGRSFDNLHSPGLSVQVNVAYALANHLAALRFDLPLPGILLIDGFTSNIGTEGEDPDRRHRMYQYMIELSRRRGKDLQVIIADNDVPEFAQAFVRATLSQSDRLIPVVVRRSQRNRAILRPPNDGS